MLFDLRTIIPEPLIKVVKHFFFVLYDNVYSVVFNREFILCSKFEAFFVAVKDNEFQATDTLD